MGFFKFLKREKKKDEFSELDLPPAPPPLEGAPADFGTSQFGFDDKLPELPDFPGLGDEDLPDKDLSKFYAPEVKGSYPDLDEEDKIPDFPSNLDMEELPAPIHPISALPNIPGPSVPNTQPVQSSPSPQDIYPRIERRLFSHERRILRERPSGKTIYVKVDRFKATLGDINKVRSDLRKSEEALSKLENIKHLKDKSFDKVRSSLDDLQKKLIFVDKTLFKGD